MRACWPPGWARRARCGRSASTARGTRRAFAAGRPCASGSCASPGWTSWRRSSPPWTAASRSRRTPCASPAARPRAPRTWPFRPVISTISTTPPRRAATRKRRTPAAESSALRRHLHRLRNEQVHLARGGVALADVVPVPQVPHRFEELRLLRLVLQVVGVLPGIDDEQGHPGLGEVRLVIVDLGSEEPARHRLVDERAPSGTHDRPRDLVDLLLEA